MRPLRLESLKMSPDFLFFVFSSRLAKMLRRSPDGNSPTQVGSSEEHGGGGEGLIRTGHLSN